MSLGREVWEDPPRPPKGEMPLGLATVTTAALTSLKPAACLQTLTQATAPAVWLACYKRP